MAIENESIRNGEQGERVYSFKEIVYRYLIEYENENWIKELDYKDIMEVGKKDGKMKGSNTGTLLDAYRLIDSKHSNLIKMLNDIFRIFRVEVFRDVFMDGVKYEFDEEDVGFICELLKRYTKNPIWKQIKKVNNDSFDGFVKIYMQENTDGLLKELDYVINGFEKIFGHLHLGSMIICL